MRGKIVLAVFFLIVLTSFGFAEAPDFLSAGGWEFGGSFMFVHRPEYPVFSGDTTEDERGDYTQTLEAGLCAGKFLADRFSLAIHPSMFYYRQKSLDSLLRKELEQGLQLGLGVEPSYYMSLGSSILLSLGGELAVGLYKGLDGMDSGVEEPNKYLALSFWLEPKVCAYYLLSGGFAPFVSLGFKMMYYRNIRDSDGDYVSYPKYYSLFDDATVRFNVILGMKYFLPAGSRFGEGRTASYNDLIDERVLH